MSALIAAVLVAVTLVVAPPALAAEPPPVKYPSNPRGLAAPARTPSTIEAQSRYQPQTACAPFDQIGTRRLATLVMSTYRAGYSGRIAGPCTEGTSEHAEGRAWDWMLNPKSKRDVDAAANFLAWATANDGRNARRLGIMYLIYNEKIWGAYRPRDGWRPSSGHKDHIHVSLTWNGARANTSFWTGRVMPTDYGNCRVYEGEYAPTWRSKTMKPCPSTTKVLRYGWHPVRVYGQSGSDIADARRRLRISGGSTFDRTMRDAVIRYQYANDLPPSGALDRPTWASLDKYSVRTNWLNGKSRSQAASLSISLAPGGRLQKGSSGAAVLALQHALYMPSQHLSAYYGDRTKERVRAKQAQLRRPVTGVWTRDDWLAMSQGS